MDRSRYILAPGIVLDARRAVWLEETGTLAVADLHLGYAWAHRASGQMLPVSGRDDTVPRLLDLVTDYRPREVVLLGDIVHRAVPVPALEQELRKLWHELGGRAALRWIAGNHDARLGDLLRSLGLPAELLPAVRAGAHLLAHGDASEDEAAVHMEIVRVAEGFLFLGHEHPALSLSDGIATTLKCLCFATAERLVVLPAFSNWAAGSDLRSRRYLSPYLHLRAPERAVVILNGKLLPVPL